VQEFFIDLLKAVFSKNTIAFPLNFGIGHLL
jgi:hypothetical protein